MEPRTISLRRVWNIGAYETIAIESAIVIHDPDKTLRSTEEELHIARLTLTKQLNQIALQELIRIIGVRNSIPHANLELREQALSIPTYQYHVILRENEAIDQELVSLRDRRHKYDPSGQMIST